MASQGNNTQHVVVTSTKSVGIAILLTLIFGSIGMFYSTVKGAIIMTLLTIVLAVVFIASNPAMLIAHFPVMWLISIIWGAMAVKSYNKEILAAA
jgi:hypothetical protein